MQQATGRGRMASLEATPQQLEEIVRRFSGRLAIAANNAPKSTVLAGDTDAIEEAVREAEPRGIRSQWLPVKYAFHSPQIVPLAKELFAGLQPHQPGATCSAPMISTVTADFVTGAELSTEYWAKNMLRPVEFARAIGRLLEDGHNTFCRNRSASGTHGLDTGVCRGKYREPMRHAFPCGEDSRRLQPSSPRLATCGHTALPSILRPSTRTLGACFTPRVRMAAAALLETTHNKRSALRPELHRRDGRHPLLGESTGFSAPRSFSSNANTIANACHFWRSTRFFRFRFSRQPLTSRPHWRLRPPH